MKKFSEYFNSRFKVSVSLMLAAAVLVFVLAVELLAGVAKRNLEKQALEQADLNSRFLSSIITIDLSSSEWVMHNNLSWFSNVSFEDTVENVVSGFGDSLKLIRRVVDDSHIEKITEDDVFGMLKSFLDYNESFKSAVMAFEPGVLKNRENGFAARMQYGDTLRSELVSEGYYVFDNAMYHDFSKGDRNNYYGFQTLRDGRQLLTIGIPLYDVRGNIIAYFLADHDPEFFSNALETYRSKGDIAAFVIDSAGVVIASFPSRINGKQLDLAVGAYPELEIGDEWVKKVLACSWNSGKASVQTRSGRLSKFNVTCVYPIKSVHYRLVVVKSGSEVFRSLNGFKLSLWGISLCSLLLVLGCATYINMAYKRKSAQNNMMAGELNAAGVIQAGILPPNPGVESNGKVLSLPPESDVYGCQKQAIVVGGDMYDYAVKDRSLFFVIGDVSGKGVPAALVMAEISSLIRYIISQKDSPEEILGALNNAVMERGDDSVLCTMTVGKLELETGRLLLSNAGHMRPLLVPAGGSPEYMKLRAGMPLYGFKDYPYVNESFVLQPGDRLLLYTDGVTESRNENGEFFGVQRTLETAASDCGKTAAQLVSHVMDRLDGFSGNAEQHDDITMLCIRYKGGKSTTLHYDTVSSAVTQIVEDILSAAGRPGDLRLRLAVEEPVQNIADYAYRDNGGDGPLDVSVSLVQGDGKERRIGIVLKDKGLRFNPMDVTAPDFSVPLEQRQPGGLGVHFIRSIMETVAYEYADGRNILHLTYLIENED